MDYLELPSGMRLPLSRDLIQRTEQFDRAIKLHSSLDPYDAYYVPGDAIRQAEARMEDDRREFMRKAERQNREWNERLLKSYTPLKLDEKTQKILDNLYSKANEED